MKTILFGKKSFKYAAPVLWNFQIYDSRQCSNFNQFKGLILGLNSIYSVIINTIVNIYTMSCETGSDSTDIAYI